MASQVLTLNGHSVHQDLKPSNILLFSDPKDDSPYAFTMKLGDFGMSSTTFATQGDSDAGPYNDGTNTFCELHQMP